MKNQIVKIAVCIAAMHISTHAQAQTAGTSGRWDLRGNSGTSTSLNFIGTTDNLALRFRTNNAERMVLNESGDLLLGTVSASGKMTISTTNPTGIKLDVTGTSPSSKFGIYSTAGNNSAGGTASATGIFGWGKGPCLETKGVDGYASNGTIVYGLYGFGDGTGGSSTSYGLYAKSFTAFSSYGVYGIGGGTTNSYGVYGVANSGTTSYGVYGTSSTTYGPNRWAGYFSGNVNVTDTAKIKRLQVGTTISIVSPNLINVGSTTGDGITIGSAEYFRDGGGNILTCNQSLVPAINALFSLGSSTARFTTVFATNGTINTSDRRDKNNIQQLKYGLNEIMKLNPVSFSWKERSDEGTKLGLIAQELQTVLPEVVRDFDVVVDEATGKTSHIPAERLGVFYADIIPVLIKGMQEQQQQIEELKQTINDLKASDKKSSPVKKANQTDAYELRNNPNPSNNSTTLSFNIPENFSSAILKVTDAGGKQISNNVISTSGKNTVHVDTSILPAETIFWSTYKL